MPLGDLAALEVSGVIAAPFISALLLRRIRRIEVSDCFFAVAAVVGVVFVVKPAFLFGFEEETGNRSKHVDIKA